MQAVTGKPRLFVYGCSFTKFSWPTWPDIIYYDLKNEISEYFNYAGLGLGNRAIECLMIESHLRHNINLNDIVMVNWSGINREDKFLWINDGWSRGRGPVFSKKGYDDDYISNHWSWKNDLIQTATSIISCNSIFNIKYQSSLAPIMKAERDFHEEFEQDCDIPYFYSHNIPKMDDWYTWNNNNVVFNDEWNIVLQDGHPGTLRHLDWVAEKIYPQLGKKLKQDTIEWCTEISKYFLDYFSKHGDYPVKTWDQGIDPNRLVY